MPLPAFALPVAGGLINMAGNLFNMGSQRRENHRQRQFQINMYNQQRADALDDWHRENAYNDPSAMMARLKAAGLNPNLAYGNPTTAGQASSTRSSQGSGYNGKAPQVETSGISDAIMMFYDIQKTQAQTDNIKAQAELAKARQETVEYQIRKMLADIGLTESKNLNIQYDNIAKDQLISGNYYKHKADSAWQDLRAGTAEADMKEMSRDIQEALKENILEQAVQKLAMSRNLNDAMKEKINLMVKEGKIKDFEIKLNELGVTKGDPLWARAISKFLEAIGIF